MSSENMGFLVKSGRKRRLRKSWRERKGNDEDFN